MSDATLEIVLRRDRAIIVAALIVLTVLAWAYVWWLADDMADAMAMGGMDITGSRMVSDGMSMMMPAAARWQPIEFGIVFAMWAVMMIGMMTPSAAPMVLLYARVGRQTAALSKPFAPTGWFFGGYVLAWIAFSLAATLAQWGLQRAAMLTPMMQNASDLFGGLVLVAAGLYQWTPLKNVCLRHCQAPLFFIQRHGGFRRDLKGSIQLGIHHGAYCIGCCWALMALLFVGGVMNLLWIAALAVLVLLEKVVPSGRVISRVAGTGLIAGGVGLLVMALR
jgi:predicted metal-binding membrane protein